MFEFLYNFFAVIFGQIMNAFYILLDLIGLPYLWLCIILFALSSRLLFLPQKISSLRKNALMPAINYDMRKLRERYGSISKSDKARLKEYRKDQNEIYKFYGVSSGNGCLVSLLQLPLLIGLFRVVRHPFEYVPQLSTLTSIEKASVNDFFGLSIEALPQEFGGIGIVIPLFVFLATLIHVVPALTRNNFKKQPVVVFLRVVQLILITWMSFCVPIAISLYWVVNDLVNFATTKIIKRHFNNNQDVKAILANTEALIKADEIKKAEQIENNEEKETTTDPEKELCSSESKEESISAESETVK